MAGAVAATPSDAPYVEVIDTRGQIDGPAGGTVGPPKWDRVEVAITIVNRLPRPIGDFRFEVALERDGSSIPGWGFDIDRPEVWVDANDAATLSFEHPLPERRDAVPAAQIRVRPRLLRYRVAEPGLDLALSLLQSGSESDQRAALESFEADRLTDSERRAAIERLTRALELLPRRPSASDALSLLFALRALGRLGAASELGTLLTLPDRLDRDAWGDAVVDLSRRVLQVRQAQGPRLEVLPSWAQKPSALIAVKAREAVAEAVRDATLRMGDAAVPTLMQIVHTDPSQALRERAWRLLVALGRPTVRSQLRLDERGPQIEAIRAVGRLGLDDAAPALADMLTHPRSLVRQAASEALTRIGPSAIPALVQRLGHRNDEAALRVLERIRRAAEPGRDPERLAEELDDLRGTRRRLVQAELQDRIRAALELGGGGRSTAAFRLLDSVYDEDKEFYLRFAPAISALYLERARREFEARDYDEALSASTNGLQVRWTPELHDIAHQARLALAHGHLMLGDWRQAAALLDARATDPETRHLRGEIAAGQVRASLDQGNRGRARAQLDRARALDPNHPALRALHRRMLWLENLPNAFAVVFAGLVAVIGMGAALRRRWVRMRMERLEAALDQKSA